MITEALQWVRDQAKPEQIDVDPDRIDAQVVLMADGYRELKPPTINGLTLATLDAMTDYVAIEPPPAGSFFLTELDGGVRLYGPPHPRTKVRECFAACDLPPIGTLTQCGERKDDGWMTAANMIPKLMTQFAPTDERAALLKVLGNVRDGATRTYQDDGVTQEVTTRKGVSMAEATALPNPMQLTPLATYPELDNDPQQYTLRAEGGDENNQPTFRLVRVVDAMFEYNRRLAIVAYLAASGIPVV